MHILSVLHVARPELPPYLRGVTYPYYFISLSQWFMIVNVITLGVIIVEVNACFNTHYCCIGSKDKTRGSSLSPFSSWDKVSYCHWLLWFVLLVNIPFRKITQICCSEISCDVPSLMAVFHFSSVVRYHFPTSNSNSDLSFLEFCQKIRN